MKNILFASVVLARVAGFAVLIAIPVGAVIVWHSDKLSKYQYEISCLNEERWKDYTNSCEYKNSKILWQKEFKAKYQQARN